jgi:hypothetical protein
MVMRKSVSTSLGVAGAIIVLLVCVSATGSGTQSLYCYACEGGVVDKAPREAFVVDVKFRNTGSVEGSWMVNVAFEGEEWAWTGTAQNLTLKPDQAKTLTWNGNVPSDAPVDSMARLVVYYDDSWQALNWWIHVVQNAELAVSSSTVR